MRLQLLLLAAATALSAGAASQAAQAATIEIKDAVARVTVVPENRSDIKIEVTRPNGQLPLTVRSFGDKTILDGDLDRRIHNCKSSGDASWVDVRGVGRVSWAEMPQVVIHTPRDVHVEAGGAVFGSVGRSASLDLDNAGCGDWTLANVEGVAKISQAGSGDTRMGSAGSLKIRVAGSGDVAAADVKGPLDISIAGSGDASVRSVSGQLEVSVAGSGDVMIGSGRATDMKVSIAGSGDVHANEVKGPISKMIMGSGSVRVGG